MISLTKEKFKNFDEAITAWAKSIHDEMLNNQLNIDQLIREVCEQAKKKKGDDKERYIKIFLHLAYEFKEIEKSIDGDKLLLPFLNEFDQNELDLEYFLTKFYDSNEELEQNPKLINFLHDYLFKFMVQNQDLEALFSKKNKSLEKIFITNFQNNFLSSCDNYQKIFENKWTIFHMADFLDKKLQELQPYEQSQISKLILQKAFENADYMKILFEKSLTKKIDNDQPKFSFFMGTNPSEGILPLLILTNQIYYAGGNLFDENPRDELYSSARDRYLQFLKGLIDILKKQYLERTKSQTNDDGEKNQILDEMENFITRFLEEFQSDEKYRTRIGYFNKDFAIDFEFKSIDPQNFIEV